MHLFHKARGLFGNVIKRNIKNLPKETIWMNEVTPILNISELGIAFKNANKFWMVIQEEARVSRMAINLPIHIYQEYGVEEGHLYGGKTYDHSGTFQCQILLNGAYCKLKKKR